MFMQDGVGGNDSTSACGICEGIFLLPRKDTCWQRVGAGIFFPIHLCDGIFVYSVTFFCISRTCEDIRKHF
jgi:hypothetical protein